MRTLGKAMLLGCVIVTGCGQEASTPEMTEDTLAMPESAQTGPTFPEKQLLFHRLSMDCANEHRAANLANKIQAQQVREKCAQQRSEFAHNNVLDNWIGEITHIQVSEDGTAADVRLANHLEGVELKVVAPGDLFFDIGENGLIRKGTPLFDSVAALSVGDLVYFDARFVNPDEPIGSSFEHEPELRVYWCSIRPLSDGSDPIAASQQRCGPTERKYPSEKESDTALINATAKALFGTSAQVPSSSAPTEQPATKAGLTIEPLDEREVWGGAGCVIVDAGKDNVLVEQFIRVNGLGRKVEKTSVSARSKVWKGDDLEVVFTALNGTMLETSDGGFAVGTGPRGTLKVSYQGSSTEIEAWEQCWGAD